MLLQKGKYIFFCKTKCDKSYCPRLSQGFFFCFLGESDISNILCTINIAIVLYG